jgi:hypothetical protein
MMLGRDHILQAVQQDSVWKSANHYFQKLETLFEQNRDILKSFVAVPKDESKGSVRLVHIYTRFPADATENRAE